MSEAASLDSLVGYGAPDKQDTSAAHGEPLEAAWPSDRGVACRTPHATRSALISRPRSRHCRRLRAAYPAPFSFRPIANGKPAIESAHLSSSGASRPRGANCEILARCIRRGARLAPSTVADQTFSQHGSNDDAADRRTLPERIHA